MKLYKPRLVSSFFSIAHILMALTSPVVVGCRKSKGKIVVTMDFSKDCFSALSVATTPSLDWFVEDFLVH